MKRMKIVVIGAGQVGNSVALELAKTHDVTVVDSDADRLNALRVTADVMTMEGDGADLEVLQEAGIAEANIIIASTDDDRVNILVCGIARMLSESVLTICRVADTAYLRSWEHTKKAFQVDLMVGSNFLTAQSIFYVVSESLAKDVAYFDSGRIEMAEFIVPAECEFAAKQIKDVKFPEGLKLAAVFEGDRMEVASGETWLREGNRLLVIGKAEEVGKFGQRLARSQEPRLGKEPSKNRLKRWIKKTQKASMSVFIMGGGEIGFQTARLLEKQDITPKIFEANHARAEFLAKNLPDSFVLNDDLRDPSFLKQEGISRADLVVVALSSDDLNLFASLLALNLGAKKVVSVIHNKEYQELFETNGVELTFNPRTEVIKEIIRHTRGKMLDKVAFVEDHKGEVIQLELQASSVLVNEPLHECMQNVPTRFVVGAVSRGGNVIIPNGQTVLLAGDKVVLFADTANIPALMEVL